MQNRLFVGNLAFSTTESDLRSKFEGFGALKSASVVTDRVTGQARGFAFVEFSDATEAARAVEALNGADLNGRALNVSVARERSGGFGGGGGSRGFGGGSAGSRRGDRGDRW